MENNIKIELVDIAGFPAVLRAIRFPHGLEHRSEVKTNFNIDNGVGENVEMVQHNVMDINPKDIQLLSNLVASGDEHAKVVRGVLVYVEITAPRFWWVEMDTYHIGAERLASESTMHIQGKNLSTDELVEMKSNLKEGTMQKRAQYFSYQTLRRIYFQRVNHRLPHWKKFCSFIETLPFAQELILCPRKKS